jgi:hypothetical protein
LQPISVLETLREKQGRYQGHGTNFDGLPFQATLSIKSQLGGTAYELHFRASDSDAAFHEELTWITNDLLRDRMALWTISSNTPGMLQHMLVDDTSDELHVRKLIFRLGEPGNKHSFRQEIRLSFRTDGTIEYVYAWGIPHEEFAVHTRTILQKEASENGNSL